MTRERIDKLAVKLVGDDALDEERPLLANGFEDAFVGFAQQFTQPYVAVYDYEQCIKILMRRDRMNRDDAIEYMDYNVTGAWVGPRTPMFLVKS